MVRAGKIGKGFTPRPTHEEPSEKETQEESIPLGLQRLKQWWSAFLIQRAWRRSRQKDADDDWGSREFSGSKLEAQSTADESSLLSKAEALNYAKKKDIIRLLEVLLVSRASTE
ncbi:hypothetical protein, conserved [Eimeria tenella]|uniref:Uncharacterized protein n=1 Tax=Eimeria tenella TaxID=5802 RepID=U6KVM6_EIMTE|nr:hypothetical protein, conserved [Eimeria tenella]CDJ40968.1 hypothetical protein, conserved [Eimeria tenella]|eukprot:XP_013231718.1 hypothetical protein, conserved [Eimeria tenella]